MGVGHWFREVLRNKYPRCFYARKKLPPGVKLHVVASDVEQLAFTIPAHVRTRAQVYVYVMKCLHSVAMEALESLGPEADLAPDEKVHVYAMFDTPDSVTPAKEMCKMRRYRYGRPPAADSADQLRRFESDEPITCPWQSFVTYQPGRRALLRYLSETILGAPADLFGPRIVVHVGDTGPIGEAELKQQFVAVRDAPLGVLLNSVDGDLIIAMLLAMPEIADKGPGGGLPTIVIRSTYYVGPDSDTVKAAVARGDKRPSKKRPRPTSSGPSGGGKDTSAAASRSGTVLAGGGDDDDDGTEGGRALPTMAGPGGEEEEGGEGEDDDMLGPPPPPADAACPDVPSVQAAINAFLGASNARRAQQQQQRDGGDATAPPAAATAATTTAEKAKRVPLREYLMVHELWSDMRAEHANLPETLSFVALLMGSDLVPGIAGKGMPIPWIGGMFAWDVCCECMESLGPLVRQTLPSPYDADTDTDEPQAAAAAPRCGPGGGDPEIVICDEPASKTAVHEVGSVDAVYDYDVDMQVVFAWLRAVYAKKYTGKLTIAVGKHRETGREVAIIPKWNDIVAATDPPPAAVVAPPPPTTTASTGRPKPSQQPRVLDQQWVLQVVLHARYGINYYGRGKMTRDPYAKDEGKSLHGWCLQQGQTLAALDVERYAPYSRWQHETHGVPPTDHLYLAGADSAYGYASLQINIWPVPAWASSNNEKRTAAVEAALARLDRAASAAESVASSRMTKRQRKK